jgi:hypothetical protein
MVVVNHGDARVHDLAAEGVAQDDQLHQGQHQRHDHQDRGAKELAHFALDNGEHSVHGYIIPGLGGIV